MKRVVELVYVVNGYGQRVFIEPTMIRVMKRLGYKVERLRIF